jgi:CheY-like chemotaxis protein
MKILVVDDDKHFLLLTEKTLDVQGYEVETTSSAMQALLRLLENGNLYNLLITDVNMPLMDGISLNKELKNSNHPIKVIGVSGYNIDKQEQKAFDYFLSKPFKLNELRTVVKEALSPVY